MKRRWDFLPLERVLESICPAISPEGTSPWSYYGEELDLIPGGRSRPIPFPNRCGHQVLLDEMEEKILLEILG